MTWFAGVLLYVLIWWTALFAVLPFGTKPVAGPDAATGWRGVPEHPRIGRKILATTLLSAVIWAVCAAVITSGLLSFRSGWLSLPPAE